MPHMHAAAAQLAAELLEDRGSTLLVRLWSMSLLLRLSE